MTARLATVAAIVVAVCFGLGLSLGRKSGDSIDSNPVEAPAAVGNATVSALPARARSSQLAADALSELARSGDHGLFTKYRGYLRLAFEAEIDEIPALIAQVGREVPDEMGGEALVEILAGRWAREDPMGALEALLQLDPPALMEAEFEVLEVVAELAPEKAWRALMGIGDDGKVTLSGALTAADFRERAIGSLLQEMSKHDPTLVVRLTTSLEKPGLHRQAIHRGLKQLAEDNPEHVIDALRQLPSGFAGGTDIVFTAFHYLSENDRDGAVAGLDELGRESQRQAIRGIANRWSRESPEAALAWIRGLPSGMPSGDALSQVMAVQAEQDPAAAAANLASLVSARTRAQLSPKVATAWMSQDPDAALGWARESLEGPAQTAAVAGMLSEGGDVLDFDIQLELAEALPGPNPAKNNFVQRWALRDAAAAADWAIAQGSEAVELFGDVARRWASSDMEGLEAFAAGLPEGELSEVARKRIERNKDRKVRRRGRRE